MKIFSLFCLKVQNNYLREKTSSTVSNREYFNHVSECQRHYASNTYFRSVLIYRDRANQYVTSHEVCFLFQMEDQAADR